MGAAELSQRDIETIRQCLAAAVNGPFFPESEFQTLIGLGRDEIAEVVRQWPAGMETERADLAVNNVLNNLLGYPHCSEADWSSFISATQDVVAGLLARWRGEHEV